jgi:integrase
MVSIQRLRRGWRVRFRIDGRQVEIYLSTGSKTTASAVAAKLELLLGAKNANTLPDPAISAWASGTKGNLRRKLIKLELLANSPTANSPPTIQTATDSYIASRLDLKDSTVTNYRQTQSQLVEYFSADHKLIGITAADANAWKHWLLSKTAKATAAKHIKRAKTMFAAQVQAKNLTENPLSSITAGAETNPDRKAHVDRAIIKRIIDACPSAQWRLIIALCRFAGLRCPSEIHAIDWADIHWESNRFTIRSPKTGTRQCPIFPELLPYLQDAAESATTQHVIDIGRDGSGNLRTPLTKLLARIKIAPWPKLFNNLRASCRVDLQSRFPSHVIDCWLGHSTKTAQLHYLHLTDAHWQSAQAPTKPKPTPVSDSPT